MVRCLEPLPHHHWWVRRAAVEALGRLLSAASSAPLLDPFTPEPKPESDDHASGPAAGVVAAAQRQLLEALRDADRRVRRASAISITQLAIAIIGRGSIPSADSDELCIPGGTARVLLEGMVEDGTEQVGGHGGGTQETNTHHAPLDPLTPAPLHPYTPAVMHP